MKLQVIAETGNDNVGYTLRALVAAIKQNKVGELLEAFADGEHFSMEAGTGKFGMIKVTITKNPTDAREQLNEPAQPAS